MSPVIAVKAFRCLRCGYVWISTKFDSKNRPKACAKCKSFYWDSERKTTNNSKKPPKDSTIIKDKKNRRSDTK